MKFLFDDGNQHVGRHGATDLRLHGVLAVAEELLDSQVLFDPFEEQFDLPAVFVKCCNCQCWQDKVVGQKDQYLACLWVLESNPSQVLWVVLRGIESSEQHRLVENDAGCSVCRCGVNPPRVHVYFGPRDGPSQINGQLKKPHGNSENAVKTKIWCPASTYVLIAIVKKELQINASLYTLLQILSVSVFEKTEMLEHLQPTHLINQSCTSYLNPPEINRILLLNYDQ